MKITFWISLFVAFYTFVGYGLLLYIIIKIKRAVRGKKITAAVNDDLLPSCTLIVAAYNEEHHISEKIANCLQLNYPPNKLNFLFISDGSTDATPLIISQYPQIQHLHQPERSGKIAAIHRAMEQITTGAVVFTDANTLLNPDAVVRLCRHYADRTVGAVAGEKRVLVNTNDDASAAGEGFYWKYESTLKKWDSELYSVVGAAGELFSVRRELYQDVPSDTILDDFMISMLIAAKGYRIIYEPDAYATENASENVTEELKRKIRIAAGGMQSILRLKPLLFSARYPLLSFQYVSHRVLRWSVTPFLMILAFVTNLALAFAEMGFIYTLLFSFQIIFYGLAFSGFVMEKRQIRIKALFIPYYFCVMNYAVIAGIVRYFFKNQNAVWEKARRRQ